MTQTVVRPIRLRCNDNRARMYCHAQKLLTLTSVFFLVFAFSDCKSVLAQSVNDAVPQHDQWNKPESGWLYVLEYSLSSDNGRIVLLDPNKGHIKGALTVGAVPEIMLAPDGKRLYVASIVDDGDMLSIINTDSGSMITSVPMRGRRLYIGVPDMPAMASSVDANLVYALKAYIPRRGPTKYAVAAFDAIRQSFLPGEASIGECVSGILLPLPDNDRVRVCCEDTQEMWLLIRQEDGLNAIVPPVHIDTGMGKDRSSFISTVTPERAGEGILAIQKDGKIVMLNGKTGNAVLVSKKALPGRWVPSRDIVRSPDGSKIYVAMGQTTNHSSGKANEVIAIDVDKADQPRSFRISRSFWNMAISNDGRYLYLMDPDRKTISVIDAENGQQIRELPSLKLDPVQLAVAP